MKLVLAAWPGQGNLDFFYELKNTEFYWKEIGSGAECDFGPNVYLIFPPPLLIARYSHGGIGVGLVQSPR